MDFWYQRINKLKFLLTFLEIKLEKLHHEIGG